MGSLSLVLLNQVDKTPVVTSGVRKAELLGQDVQAVHPNPAPVSRATGTIEVIRGTARATVPTH